MSEKNQLTLYELVQSLKRLIWRWKFLLLLFFATGTLIGYYKSTQYVPYYSTKLIATSKTLPSAVVIKAMRSLNNSLHNGKIHNVSGGRTILRGKAEKDLLNISAAMFNIDKEQLEHRKGLKGMDFFEITIKYRGSFNKITTFIKSYVRDMSKLMPGSIEEPLIILSDFQNSTVPVNTKYSIIYLSASVAIACAVFLIFFIELYRSRSTVG